MKETIITEEIRLDEYSHEKTITYRYPEIDNHIKQGYSIKEMFHNVTQYSNGQIQGIVMTVHLQKLES